MPRYKYPRTPHLSWSPGRSIDDIIMATQHWRGRKCVMTEKVDGENTTMYSNHIHARSLDSKHHPSQSWVKRLHSEIAHKIPQNWRICGENMYAKHSIFYSSLPSYFLVFSIWNQENCCLSWDETKEWCRLLGLEHVPEVWSGVFDETYLRDFWRGYSRYRVYTDESKEKTAEAEGYVIRTVRTFPYDLFENSVIKYVRKDHVQTNEHWMHQKVVPNELNN